jgi:Tfp pilus assembly protein PilX
MMHHEKRRGGALVIALLTLMVVMLMAGTLLRSLLAARHQSMKSATALQAAWLADSAIQRAQVRLTSDPSYRGETWEVELDDDYRDTSTGSAKITVGAMENGKTTISVNARIAEIGLTREIDHYAPTSN